MRTYELISAKANSLPTGLDIALVDRDGRVCHATLADLKSDRLVWDLVHLGITYSVIIGGAETNGPLHSALRIPYPQPDERSS